MTPTEQPGVAGLILLCSEDALETMCVGHKLRGIFIHSFKSFSNVKILGKRLAIMKINLEICNSTVALGNF
jgi:hypothetical protein